MKPTNQNHTIFLSTDKLIRIVRKSEDLARSPQHDYPCVLLYLRPKRGTRVQLAKDGSLEYMARWGELRALLVGIAPELNKHLPARLSDKPAARVAFFAHWNAKRLTKN